MSVITKDLGAVTAYAAAVNRGYTGTKEEFETLMASYATVAQQAAESAQSASSSAQGAFQAATSANTAMNNTRIAESNAQSAASGAQGYAQYAQQSAQSASRSATDAESAKQTAVDAVDGFAAGAQQALDGVNQAGNNWKSLAQAQKLDSEAWAVGQRDGEDVGSSDPAYHNNAKYYAEQTAASSQQIIDDAAAEKAAAQIARQGAEAAASNASASAAAAEDAADRAEAAQQAAEAAAEQAEGAIVVDDTLSVEGRAADAKETGDRINKIKEVTVTEVSTIRTEDILSDITFQEGYYMGPTGVIAAASTLKYSNKIPVSEGDVLALSPSNSEFRFVCAFTDNVAMSESGATNVNSFTVPSGINYVVVTLHIQTSYAPTALNHTHVIISSKNILDDDIDAINSHIATMESEISAFSEVVETETYTEDESSYTVPTFTAGGINVDGSTLPYVDYEYTQKIPVSEGDSIEALANGTAAAMRWVCAYYGNMAVSASGSSADKRAYTVPSGIDGIVITTRKASNVNSIRKTASLTKTAAHVKQIPMGYITKKGSLVDGESIVLPYHNVKINNCYVFNANISEFSSIKFAKETESYIIVDSTNLTIHNDQTSLSVPHGLTIDKNITLIVQNETSYRTSLIRIASDGEIFDYTTPVRFIMDTGAATIISNESTLTGCVFSWVSKNINAPIWIFGDSYLSWYDVRWTYYLAKDGYVNTCLLNGYAGQGSNTAYDSLVNLLAITIPKKVVWCLGMNDPDADSAVNASWKSYYDKVVALQKKYGFELVLYTVPTTPTMNNRFKNSIIRESGIRFIEADNAVRIDENGHWIGNGTERAALAEDNVHPTEIGAKIIYHKILADLPEIMCNF